MARRFFVVVGLVVLSVMSFSAIGMVGGPQPVWAEDTAHAGQKTALININTALSEELATIKGIGDKTAQAIVAYRNAHGPFAATEDVMNVKGVGEKKYEAIKDQITLREKK